MEFIEAQVAQISHGLLFSFFKLFRLMDVDRDKHFSVSDLQVLEEEDNRVSGQALEKNTSFWNRFLLLQRLFSTRVSPHVVFANWFSIASFWGPFFSNLPTQPRPQGFSLKKWAPIV